MAYLHFDQFMMEKLQAGLRTGRNKKMIVHLVVFILPAGFYAAAGGFLCSV